MRIAIIHDWLTAYGGAERVLKQMLELFPEADIFTVVDFLPREYRGFLDGKKVTTSFIQHLPLAKKKYRNYLPLMPLAVEQFDLSGYDVIISKSHAVAKGVLIGPDQLHICYCYTPIRYAWDLQHQYLNQAGLNRGLMGFTAKWLLHKIRVWDYRTSNSVDRFVAVSEYIARRIHKVYQRDSAVIYPPVDVSAFTLCEEKEPFYLTSSRLVPYKKIDLIAEAFSHMPDKKLIVIGDGPDYKKVSAKAKGNVVMMGYQPFEVLRDHLQRAQAFIFAAEEDFGIAPIEAQSCGTPVIAFGKGAATETIRGIDMPRPTGVFFGEQTVSSIIESVRVFEQEKDKITAHACRENAMRFSYDKFNREMTKYIAEQIDQFALDKMSRHHKLEVI